MKTIDGISVGNYTYAMISADIESGKRVYVATPDSVGSCPNCGGGGVIVVTSTPERPTTALNGTMSVIDGEWYRVENKSYPCPICAEVPDMNILFEDSGLTTEESYWGLDFIENMAGKENAVSEARKLLSGTPRPRGLYTFFGDYGVGKSGILKCVTSAFIKSHVKSKYIRAADFLSEVRSTFSDDDNSEDKVVSKYSRYQFLAIDEVDRIGDTEWARSTTFLLLDRRYNDRGTVSTAMATNKFPDSMGEDWKYLMSRMLDGIRVPVGGESLRGVKT